MATRKDIIQLQIRVNGEMAGKSYKDLIKQSRALKAELLNLTPGTDKFIKKSAELRTVNGRLAEIRKETRGVAKGMEDLRILGVKIPGVFRQWLPALGAVAIVGGLRRISQWIGRIAKESLDLFDKQAKVNAQAQAVITSTGQAAGRTLEDLQRQARDLQQITLFGDEQTQNAQNILLTFTKIREEMFDRAVPAVLDMATALDLDLKSASIQVGKALNDPVLGVTALSRAGIQFSEDQKEVIRSMVETGDVAGAQTIILKELETQFKGSAEAAAQAGAGGLQQLQNRYSDIKEVIGDFFNRVLVRVQPILAKGLDLLERWANTLVNLVGPTNQASNNVRRLQSEFNLEVETLKRANLSQEQRRTVIEQINAKYGDYLPNLLSEKSTIEDIEAAQRGANEAFAQKITLLALEETAAELQRKRLEAKTEELRLQKAVTAAEDEFQRKADRATRSIIRKSDSEQQAAVRSLDALNKAKDNLQENIDLQNELRDEFDETLNAAAALGFDLADLLGGTGATGGGGGGTGGGGGDDPDPDDDEDKKREERLQAALQREEVFAQRQEALAAINRNEGLESEKEFQEEIKGIRINAYANQLRLLEEAGQEQSLQYLQIRKKISDLEATPAREVDPFQMMFGLSLEGMQKIVQQREQLIQEGYTREELLLRQKLAQGQLSEQEFEQNLIDTKIERVQEEMAFLRQTNQEETLIYQEKYTMLLELQNQYHEKRLENLHKNADQERTIEEARLNLATDAAHVVSDIIRTDVENYKAGLDEKYNRLVDHGKLTREQADRAMEADMRRRRRAIGISKAFEIAAVKLKLAAEIQGIWKNANENPLNALIPGWGPAFATIQSIAAGLRATRQINTIARSQFEGGGSVPRRGHRVSDPLYSPMGDSQAVSFPAKTGGKIEGPSHEEGGVKFITKWGFLGEARGGEVILNEDQQKALGGPKVFREAGVPGFETGGQIPLSTGSRAPADSLTRQATAPSAQLQNIETARESLDISEEGFRRLERKLDTIAGILAAWPMRVRADVSIQDINSAQSDLASIESIANA